MTTQANLDLHSAIIALLQSLLSSPVRLVLPAFCAVLRWRAVANHRCVAFGLTGG
ncbi:MAG: hypothetical protein GY778_31585 [bacterium]|nr:hypothetical protein [bacterium]